MIGVITVMNKVRLSRFLESVFSTPSNMYSEWFGIAKLYAYYKGNPTSCGLHPKLCKNNDYLTVDTTFDERHFLLVFKLDWESTKNRIS